MSNIGKFKAVFCLGTGVLFSLSNFCVGDSYANDMVIVGDGNTVVGDGSTVLGDITATGGSTININIGDGEASKKPKEYHVSSCSELARIVTNIKSGDRVILDKSIVLDREIKIKESITFDLNGFSIDCLKSGDQIVIGDKIYDHTDHHNINHPGYYTKEREVSYVKNPRVYNANLRMWVDVPDTKIETYKDVWHPGWTEVKDEKIYKYLENIDVVIENGKIKGARGIDGKDGIEDTLLNNDGHNGTNGNAPILLVSGTLRVQNAKIIGGDGGNGGNGAYQYIIHIPFFTGNGGDGGNGGCGGAGVVRYSAKTTNLVVDSKSSISCGKSGNGGKGSEPNRNHWIGKGRHGRNGDKGKNGKSIEYLN